MRVIDGNWNGSERSTDSIVADKATDAGPQQVSEPSDVIPANTTTPYTLAIGSSETGVINSVGDHDWFSITLVAGQSYAFTLTGSGTLSDTYLELHDSSGALIGFDDDGIAAGGSSLIRWTATTSGTYYLNAQAFEDASDPTVQNVGPYTISANIGPAQNPLDTIDLHYTAPLHIDVYFATSGQTFGGIKASRSWTASEKTQAMAALATWSAVTGVTFSTTTVQANAEFTLSLGNLGDPNTLGQFQTISGKGFGAFNPSGFGWTTAGLQPGGAGFTTLIHEFGHGLGLAHPHDNGAGGSEIMQGVLDEFGSYGTFLMNQGVFTVMSYNDGWQLSPGGGSTTATAGNEATPGPLDIALVQLKYGANATTNAGSNTYTMSSTSSSYKAIWDTGGDDTISFSGSAAATIDLRAATLQTAIGGGGFVSYVNGAQGGYTIAHGVVIENAIGGFGNDTLIGNDAANHLTGNNGDDLLIGGAGGDALDGGIGSDTASYADATAGVTAFLTAPGANTGFAAGDTYVSIENITGSAFDDALGGDGGPNSLIGGAGNDYLDGGAGTDTLIGGAGNDAYVVDSGDNIIEIANEGIDTVFAYLNWTLGANFENLVLLGAAVTGFGNESNNAIAGDALDNTLAGFGGSDNIDGGAGNDYIDGGAGADFMHGGLGNDSFVVESAGDIVDEAAGQGVDTVFAYISFTLGANLENLFLLGTALVGYGNSAGNVIYGDDQNNTLGGFGGNDTIDGGAGNDYIDGGAGIDFMHGGLGNDTFVVDNASDTTDEASGEGTDTVFAYVNWTLAANTENLTLLGSATSATGNELNNVLVGNTLANTFTGGAGDDKFVFRAADLADGVQDTITDFEAHGGTENDVISFRGISASAITMHDVSGGVEIDIDLGGGHTASVLVQNQTTATIADDIFFGI